MAGESDDDSGVVPVSTEQFQQFLREMEVLREQVRQQGEHALEQDAEIQRLRLAVRMAQSNQYGGLTLVPAPGFVDLAIAVKASIEKRRDDVPVDIAIPKVGRRASGEPYVQLSKDNVGARDCVFLTGGPGTPDMLIDLQVILGYLVGRRARRIAVVSSYMPLTRSDKDEGALELALMKHIVHMIESSAYGRLDRFIAVDLHAAQEVMAGSRPGLITEVSLMRRLLEWTVADVQRTHPGLPIVLLMPDEGAQKRYEQAVIRARENLRLPNLPIVRCDKRRTDSQKSELVDVTGDREAVRGAVVIGVDDEVATGGTNIHAAEFVKNQFKAAVYVGAVVHGIFCGDAPQRLRAQNAIDRFYVTDTVSPRSEITSLLFGEFVRVMPWEDDLAQVVLYHHLDENIRDMR